MEQKGSPDQVNMVWCAIIISCPANLPRQRSIPVIVVVNIPDVPAVVPVVVVSVFPVKFIRPSQVIVIIKIQFKPARCKYIIILMADNLSVIPGQRTLAFPVDS
jgi:hypothetical protein